MKFDPDDPRLTAYALEDLPEDERAAVEMELQQSPECREAVEEIRQTAKALSDQFAAESCSALSPEQRNTIQNKLEPANVVRLPRRKMFATVLTALAACLAGVLVWQFWFVTPGRQRVMVTEKRGNTEPEKVPLTLSPRGDSAPREQKPTIAPQESTPALMAGNSAVETLQPAVTRKPDANTVTDSAWKNAWEASSVTDLVKKQKDASDIDAQNQKLWYWKQGTAPPVSGVAPSDGWSGNTSAGNGDAKALQLGLNENKPGTTFGNSSSDDLSLAPESVARSYRVIAESATRSVGRVSGNKEETNDDLSEYRSGRPSPNGAAYQNYILLRDATDTAKYPHLTENSFVTVRNSPLSTFSIDVDTASYANVRRFLNEGRMPPRDAVRIEEMINYFSYQYPQPKGDDPFSASIEVAGCPWNSEHRLVRVGLKGREIARDKRPPSNFVFLIDVSGSMRPRERLPLIQQALRQLVKKMTENDRVAIVVYANDAGVRLESTSCSEKEKILEAIDELTAGGGTNGGDGIQQAYRVAGENFIRDGVNRVLLCTDGDFNVGITDQKQLVHMIEEKAKSGVFLTTLGVGTDNYKDALMQKLADKGNGNYHYLDTLEEAQKVLIEQMSGTLVTIAKDVKIQIEFNPARVNAYRLIGYEKRMLNKEDFNNDARDAGEIGAGHTVTALYEIVPAGTEIQGAVDDLKYQHPAEEKADRYVDSASRELLTLKLRYKKPDGDRSRLLEFPVTDSGKRFANASADFKFAAAVASFGMLLRDSEYKGDFSYGAVRELAEQAKGADENGYRAEFLNLLRKAGELQR